MRSPTLPNPENGAICCIDHTKDEVIIATRKFIDSGDKQELKGGIRVGSIPACVTFKRFGKKGFFIVACTQDAKLHVIDANSFELTKRISVSQSGVSWVTNSRNPQDPFVYYCYGGGHDSTIGVIDIRGMADRGPAFGDSMDCMISANGKTAYRRGPWSPSGFESLRLSNSFAEKKPIFVSLYRDHRSTHQYLPDAIGELTAAGSAVYSSDLKQKLATTDHLPVCFLETKPFIVCASKQDQFRRSKNLDFKLTIVSANTFNRVGSMVNIPGPSAQILNRFIRTMLRHKQQ